MMTNYILAFSSTHKVLKAESLLKEASVVFRLDPAPSDFTEYCELVIAIEGEVLEDALNILKAEELSPKSIYERAGEGYVKV